MIHKILNSQIGFILIGAFLGYFIIPDILFSTFRIVVDKGLGAVIGAALGYFFGRII